MTDGKLNNGAVVLFSNNIDEYPQFRLRMARFVGNDKNEFIDNQRIEGNFFDMLDAGMSFFFKHLSLSGKITDHSLQREERLEIPYLALREALVNSLCHRRWEAYNLTNSIAIYDDRIEIANPGILPPQITTESIKEPHESYPYNLNIAETLYRSMFLENWGSGAKRIMDACHEQGMDEPVWSWNGAFVTITFKRKKSGVSDIPIKITKTEEALSSPQARPKFAPSSPQVRQLIMMVNDSYYSVRQMAEICGFQDPKHFREGYIKPALIAGAIERLYPNQPNHPKQKYKLTEIAKEWKTQNIERK